MLFHHLSRRTFVKWIRNAIALWATSPLLSSCGREALDCEPRSKSLTGAPLTEAKYLRSLAGLTPQHAHFDVDTKLKQSIVTWCRNIRLAGKRWNLCLRPESVFQFQSLEFNNYTFIAAVDNPRVLKRILESVNNPKLEAKIGIKLKNIEVLGGILQLHRMLRYDPSTSDSLGTKRCTVMDSYWIDVYAKKSLAGDFLVIPLVRLYPFYAGPCYYRERSAEEQQQLVDDLAGYFQEPDDVILTWHEVASSVSLDRSRTYLYACFEASNEQRIILARDGGTDWTPHLHVVEDPSDHTPVSVFTNATLDRLKHTLWLPGTTGEPNQTEAPDARAVSAMWRVDYEYVKVGESPQGVPPDIPLRQITSPGPGWHLSPKLTPLATPPKPMPPPTTDPMGAVVVPLLLQASAGGAAYTGEGYFRTKAPALAGLAAGNNNWGSPETMAVGAVIGIQGGSAIAVGASAAGLVAKTAKIILAAKIDKQLDACYEKDGEACESCVHGSLGWKLNSLQAGAASAGMLGSALTATTCGVGFIPSCIAGIIGLAVNAASIVDAALNGHRMLAKCHTDASIPTA
jgi:hypothetical protein